jgi:hypothetical protein
MRSTEPFSAEFGAALFRFNKEAAFYCADISDPDAHEYAMDYAGILRRRAKGLEPEPHPVSSVRVGTVAEFG